MLTDVRYALRALRLAPGFTLVALFIFMLGIGATTAMFSVVDAVVLKALPFPDEGRLVTVLETTTPSGRPSPVAPQNYLEWQARPTGLFSELGAFGRTTFVAASPELKHVAARGVSASLLRVLGVRPALGSVFTEEHETDGQHRVLLISDAVWRRRFNADPAVVGKTLAGTDGPWMVVGVFAPEFGYPAPEPGVEFVWHPWVVRAAERERSAQGQGKSWYLSVVGRLAPGVSVEQASNGMTTRTTELARAYPDWFVNRGSIVMPLRSWLVGDSRPALLMLLGAVALVLLIACANVANLVLARSTTRAREIAIRSALGASRWDLTRGLLVEGLVLSAVGAALGVLLAWWSLEAVGALLPRTLFRLDAIAINLRVLAVAAGTAAVSGVVFGWLPAWQYSRPNLSAVLGQTSGGGTSGATRRRLRTLLMVSEVALAVVLLVGASLFLVSFARVMRVDVGFDYKPLVLVRVVPVATGAAGQDKDAEKQRRAAAIDDARRALEAHPSVESVAFMMSGAAPFSGGSASATLRVAGRPPLPAPANSVEIKAVSPDYFHTMRMTMARGQGFTPDDPVASGPGAIVISELAAKRFFGGDDPIGQAVQTSRPIPHTVVGVVRGSRTKGPESAAVPEVYLPVNFDYPAGGAMMVRLRPGAAVSSDELRRAAASAGTVAAPVAQRMSDLYDMLLQPRQLNTVLVAVFGLLALTIAAVGIYGVMAYVVAQRAREIGVRMALGARPLQVQADVLREAGAILAAGIVLGGIGAALLAQWVSAMLFEVDAQDPRLYALAIGVLILAGLAAAYVPARRASRVDPAVVLRS